MTFGRAEGRRSGRDRQYARGAYRRGSSPPAGFAAAAEQVSAPWLVTVPEPLLPSMPYELKPAQ